MFEPEALCIGVEGTVSKRERKQMATGEELSTFPRTLLTVEDSKAADCYPLMLARLCHSGEEASVKAEDLIVIKAIPLQRRRHAPRRDRIRLIGPYKSEGGLSSRPHQGIDLVIWQELRARSSLKKHTSFQPGSRTKFNPGLRSLRS
jgi:hypothetical protein